ncbi:MAG: hypothetical protein COV99_09565, partial [Bacteroidetes bacterium CG12_big_fil_rev_8_21_14_0_65_60_17]
MDILDVLVVRIPSIRQFNGRKTRTVNEQHAVSLRHKGGCTDRHLERNNPASRVCQKRIPRQRQLPI